MSHPAGLELIIENLVLEGFGFLEESRVRAALEGELERLIQERGLPSSFSHSGGVEALDAGSVRLAPHADAETIGARVAESVYRGLSSPARGEVS